MINAKEAQKISNVNDVKVEEQIVSLLTSFEIKVNQAAAKGKYTTEPTTFSWTQVSPEILKLAEDRLVKLGYKVNKTEDFAYKTFTVALSWG